MLIPYHDDNPTHRVPFVTVTIIVLNLLAAAPFGFHLQPPTHQMRVLWSSYGFVPRQLTNLGTGKPVEVDLYRELGERPAPVQNRKLIIEPSGSGVTLTLLTSMFLHAGPWHLLGNMLFFWIFGNNIEDRLGHVLFTLFYLLGGIAATLCHWLMSSAPFDAVPMIGASGAVAVMMGAYIVTYPKANIRVLFLLGCIPLFFEVPAMLVLAFWIGEQLLAAYWQQQGFVTDVALWAHIGGFAIGAAFMPLLSAGTPEPTQDWKREADEQFDYEHVDPSRPRRPPVADDRGIWWEEPPRREPPGYQRRSPWEDPP